MRFIKRMILKEKYSSKTYCDFLKKKGVEIGKNVQFIAPRFTNIDLSRICLLKIGNDVTFSDHITILTHDFSWSVVARMNPGEIYPLYGKVTIGNNVFVGSHSAILCNVKVGNNVVIGYGAIVTKDIPDNSVVAGAPAKVICSIDEFKNKIKIKSEKCLGNLIDNKKSTEDDFRENINLFKSLEDIKKEYPSYYNKLKLYNLKDYYQIYENLEDLKMRYQHLCTEKKEKQNE